MPKVYNCFNAPRGKKSPSGEEIYKWTYLDKDGNEQSDHKNVKEEINSFLNSVDYKAQIKRGEIDENGVIQPISRDYTGLPDNTVDIFKFVSNLASMDKKQVTDILERFKKGTESSIQTKQVTDSERDKTNQVIEKTTQNKSQVISDTDIIDGKGDK